MADLEELGLIISITDKSTVNLPDLIKQLEQLKNLADNMASMQIQTANISSINNTTKAISKTAIELENAKNRYEELAKGMASGAIRGEELRTAAIEAEKLSTQINKLDERLKLEGANQGLQQAQSSAEQVSQEIKKVAMTAREAKAYFDEFGKLPAEYVKQIQLAEKFAKAKKEVIATTKETDKLQKTTKQAATGFDRIAQAFKRIILYRVIRNLIAQIGRAFTEGMKNYVQYSETADKTLSNLVNTGNQLKNTLGITFVNILQALEPLITSLADSVIDIANSINALFAAMRGQDTFDKAKKSSDSYAESLKNVTNQLLSFDKFEVLATQPILFEEGDVSEQLSNMTIDTENAFKAFENIKELITSIVSTMSPAMSLIMELFVALLPAITGVINIFSPLINWVIKGVTWLVQWLDSVNALVPALAALGVVLLTLNFKKQMEEARLFNAELIVQKDKVYEAELALKQEQQTMDGLRNSTVGFTDETIRLQQAQVNLAEKTLLAEKAQLKQMQTTQNLRTAMTGLQVIVGAAGLGASLGDLIKNWSELSTAEKIQRISTIALTAAYTGLAIAQMFASATSVATMGIAGVAAAIALVASIASAVATVSGFSNGGIPGAAQGTMFVTNEFGKPELMYENQRGQVEISNQESLENSFERAINNTIPYIFGGLLQGNGGGDVSFRPDGNALAIAIMPYLTQEFSRQGLKVVRA